MEYLNLVTNFDGRTIKIEVILLPSNQSIKPPVHKQTLILDTGADKTALTRQFLQRNGYGKYTNTAIKKNTATGPVELYSCEITGLIMANEFKFGKMNVDVLDNWQFSTCVGVIGMDIISQMTFILSHNYRKFLLTKQDIPELSKFLA